MDIKLEIDFDYSKFKENLLSLRNYISLGFRCEDIDFKNAAIASIDRMMEEVSDDHDVNLLTHCRMRLTILRKLIKIMMFVIFAVIFTMSWTIMNVSCTVSSLKS